MKYTVVVSLSARTDLTSIFEYIFFHFQEPGTALRIRGELMDALASLEVFPARNPLMKKKALREKGIRKMVVKNYIVCYTVNDEFGTVEIARILYAGRDIEKILTESIE